MTERWTEGPWGQIGRELSGGFVAMQPPVIVSAEITSTSSVVIRCDVAFKNTTATYDVTIFPFGSGFFWTTDGIPEAKGICDTIHDVKVLACRVISDWLKREAKRLEQP